jgi:hypothetical protein
MALIKYNINLEISNTMYYRNNGIPHIGTRPVSPGFVAGSIAPVAPVPVIAATPALVTSQVAVAPPVAVASSILPVVAATTATVIDTGCPVGKGLK